MSSALEINQWSSEQVQLIKDQIAPDASDSELQLFMQVAQSKGLNPFNKEIYAVSRWDADAGRKKMTIQVGIDGYRSIAESTGEYAGSETYWCGPDGQWVDVWLKREPPAAAKVIVYRKGCDRGFSAVALFDEYKQTRKGGALSHMWERMSSTMIAKCAESLALRKAFPRNLGGLYTTEEMGQADVQIESAGTNGKASVAIPAAAHAQTITKAQVKRLHTIASNHGWDKAEAKVIISGYGYESSREIHPDDYEAIVAELESRPVALEGEGEPAPATS